jgi:hypothetical protein
VIATLRGAPPPHLHTPAAVSGDRRRIRKLIAEVYDRPASPDRIGPVQDPVWAKNVVARRIAIDGAGLVRPKLPPDLDPETLSRRSLRAGEIVGRGDEARRFVGTDRNCSGPEPAAVADSPAAVTLAKVSDIAAARNAFQSCCLYASRQGAAAARKPPCMIR